MVSIARSGSPSLAALDRRRRLAMSSKEKPSESKPVCPNSAVSENTQQITNQQDHQDRAEPYAAASAIAPPAVAVVAPAPAEHQNQNNNKYDQSQVRSPSLEVSTPELSRRLYATGHFASMMLSKAAWP